MHSTHPFLQRHAADVLGMISGFDRLRLRGTLRLIANAAGMQTFLSRAGVLLKDFAHYVEAVTARVKQATEGVATAAHRPVLYLARPSTDKEAMARAIAERDGIRAGLICTLKSVEVCWSYDIHRNRATKQLDLVPASRKCLHYYHYLVHPELGFLHVRLQSWFPCVPSMTIDLEVKVLWGVGRNDPSEPQGADREGSAESSGERDLRGDVQKPDRRRRHSGRAGREPRSSRDQRVTRKSGARAGTVDESYLGRSHLTAERRTWRPGVDVTE